MGVLVEPTEGTVDGTPICPKHTAPMRAGALGEPGGLTRLLWHCPYGCVTAAVPLPEAWAEVLGVGRPAV